MRPKKLMLVFESDKAELGMTMMVIALNDRFKVVGACNLDQAKKIVEENAVAVIFMNTLHEDAACYFNKIPCIVRGDRSIAESLIAAYTASLQKRGRKPHKKAS